MIGDDDDEMDSIRLRWITEPGRELVDVEEEYPVSLLGVDVRSKIFRSIEAVGECGVRDPEWRLGRRLEGEGRLGGRLGELGSSQARRVAWSCAAVGRANGSNCQQVSITCQSVSGIGLGEDSLSGCFPVAIENNT